MRLQDVGRVHNINLVTPEHIVPQVVLSILHARELGLRLPIVYNTSAFDSLESIHLLDGLVDIYLPDFKVWNDSTSKRLLKADNYAAVAKESIKAMHEQVGDLCFTPDGIAKKGVLVRHLVMPEKEDEGCEIMRHLATVSKDTMVHVSSYTHLVVQHTEVIAKANYTTQIMEQYFPRAHVGKPRRGGKATEASSSEAVRYADINRPVQVEEMSIVRKVGLTEY